MRVKLIFNDWHTIPKTSVYNHIFQASSVGSKGLSELGGGGSIF